MWGRLRTSRARVGAMTVADGVSYAPHRIVDVTRLGADVYLFSTYKTYGTHVGVMWIKEHCLIVSSVRDTTSTGRARDTA